MNRFVYCPGGIVMFDRLKNSMLGPLPAVNQSRKHLRTFFCHRISFCPFSSSPFFAKKDMYKSLSQPSGGDSALRSCVTKREKWVEIHITVPSTINKGRTIRKLMGWGVGTGEVQRKISFKKILARQLTLRNIHARAWKKFIQGIW